MSVQSGGGPVEAFWKPLRRMVAESGIQQKALASRLRLSESALSEMLGGRRKGAPEWQRVQGVVEACYEQHGYSWQGRNRKAAVDFWKLRHLHLVQELEEAEPEAAGQAPAGKCMACDGGILAGTTHHGDNSSMFDTVQRAYRKEGRDRTSHHHLDKAAMSMCFVHRIRYLDALHHLFVDWARQEYHGLSFKIVPGRLTRQELPEAIADGYRLQASTHLLDASRLLLCDDLLGTLPSGTSRARSREPGLAGLSTLLTVLGRDGRPSRWSERTSRVHRAVLKHPIAGSADVEDTRSRVTIPKIADAYVDPGFRVAVYKEGCSPQSDEWWKTQQYSDAINHQLASYLAGCALNPRMLLVLGDPGAGKSLLTKLVAARVPAADFLPVRVELRHSRQGDDIMAQLTQAVRDLVQTEDPTVTWSSVAAFAPKQMPVLLFDGFDELLQAGKTDHFDYLNKLAEFQQRAMDNDRPVAVVVTSRTVVADLAAIPADTLMLRLDPFDDSRIDRWIDVWNCANRGVEGTEPVLERAMIRDYENLAQQPLLLFMLSLYFTLADASDLGTPSRVELYERLLRLFMGRQVKKVEPGLRPSEVTARVERELDYLSAVATGMFARGKQGLTTEEAEYDLGHLVTGDDPGVPASRLLFGRFFFIHDAQELAADGTDWHWYEFLHATFGEYLVARRIARILNEGRAGELEVEALYAGLSNSLLTDRDQIIQDLHELGPDRSKVPELLAHALDREPAGPDSGYQPKTSTVTCRLAYFSANLLMVALSTGLDTPVDRLFPGMEAILALSARMAFWHSQFSPGEWDTFTRAITRASRTVNGQNIEALLGWPVRPVSLDEFTFEPDTALPFEETGQHVLRRLRMLHDPAVEHVLEPVLPFFRRYVEMLDDQYGRAGSPGSALMNLVTISAGPDLLADYRRAIDHLGMAQASPTWHWCCDILLRAYIADRERLSPADRRTVLNWVADLSDTKPGTSKWEPLMNLVLAEVQAEEQPDDAALPLTSFMRAEASTAEELLSRILASASPGRLPIRILKRAIELDLVGWCTENASGIVEWSDDEALSALTPLDRWYLQNRAGVSL